MSSVCLQMSLRYICQSNKRDLTFKKFTFKKLISLNAFLFLESKLLIFTEQSQQ